MLTVVESRILFWICRWWMASFGKEVQCVLLIEGLTIQQRLVWVLFPTLVAFGYLKWIVVLYTGVCSVVKYVIVLWQLIPLGTGSDFARTFGWYVCFLSYLIYVWHGCLLTSIFFKLVSLFIFKPGLMILVMQLIGLWEVCFLILSFCGVWSPMMSLYVNGWSMNSCMETEHSDPVLCVLYSWLLIAVFLVVDYWLQYS